MSLATLANEALNATWRINVSGKVYGPYTGHQLKAFADEGRVAPHSIVQAGERGPWITAIDDPVLGQFFVKRSFDKPAGADNGTAAQFANVVIVADLKSGASRAFEQSIAKLGEVFRLNVQTWLLHTECTAGSVRNELVPHLGANDSLFVVDASRGGRSTWFNWGPEADAKIRKVWRRQAQTA
jgi:hypothetical protein